MSADEHLGGQFKMHTNIKAAPGSQGTLFQGGYPTSHPRGYTPERLHALTDAANWLDPQRTYKPHAAATAALRDTLARSTVPVEHVQDLHFTATPHAESELEAIDARGVYKRPGQTALTGGLVKVHPDAVRGMTTIHEVGHHVSHVIDKTEHSAYDTPQRRGTEEGFAENYAETHFRDRRGKPQRSTSTGSSWGRREKSFDKNLALQHTFATKRRESPLHPKQFDVDSMSKKQQGLPPEHISGQIPLLDKTGGGEYHQHPETGEWGPKPGPRDWDYTYEDQTKGLKRERD